MINQHVASARSGISLVFQDKVTHPPVPATCCLQSVSIIHTQNKILFCGTVSMLLPCQENNHTALQIWLLSHGLRFLCRLRAAHALWGCNERTLSVIRCHVMSERHPPRSRLEIIGFSAAWGQQFIIQQAQEEKHVQTRVKRKWRLFAVDVLGWSRCPALCRQMCGPMFSLSRCFLRWSLGVPAPEKWSPPLPQTSLCDAGEKRFVSTEFEVEVGILTPLITHFSFKWLISAPPRPLT